MFNGAASGGEITLPNSFCDYSGSSYIWSTSDAVDFKDCDGFTVANNMASSDICVDACLSVTEVGKVLIHNNDTAEGGRSGLLEGGSVSITGNTDVIFSNDDWDTIYYRGSTDSLIHSSGAVALTGNGAVSFTDNINSSTGGLLKGSTLSLSENNTVTFQGNVAASLMEFNGHEFTIMGVFLSAVIQAAMGRVPFITRVQIAFPLWGMEVLCSRIILLRFPLLICCEAFTIAPRRD